MRECGKRRDEAPAAGDGIDSCYEGLRDRVAAWVQAVVA